MLNNTLKGLGGIGAIALVVLFAFALGACGGSDTGSTVADAAADEAAHVEDAGDVEGDEGEEGSTDMDDMDMSDADADPNAYLEAAPKDALYLVEMTNFAFTPSVLEVAAGEVLEIAVQNVEPLLHDFTIDRIDADVHVSYLEGSGQHAHAEPESAAAAADVHFALSEPGVGVVHLKANEPGEYEFYCTVPGHREAGMEGTLIVR